MRLAGRFLHNYCATVLIFIWRVGSLISHIANFATSQEERTDWLGVGHRVDQSLFQRQSKFPSREHGPGNIPAGVNAVGSQNAVSKDERRRSHAWNPNPFSAEILYRFDISAGCRLDPEAALMDARSELYV